MAVFFHILPFTGLILEDVFKSLAWSVVSYYGLSHRVCMLFSLKSLPRNLTWFYLHIILFQFQVTVEIII